MTHLPGRLHHFWFAPAPAERLAMLRIILGLFALGYLVPRYTLLMGLSQLSSDSFEPVGASAWLREPLPMGVFQGVVIVTLLLNGAFLLGWRYRLTGPLFGLLLVFVLCYRNSWSMIFHNDNTLVLHALVLGFVPAADAYSVDQRQGRAGSLLFGRSETTMGWQYGWPIRLLATVTVLGYFLAGVAKITGPTGLAWTTGDVMRDQLAVDALRKIVLGSRDSNLLSTFYNESLLFAVAGAGTLVLELGAPLVLANRRLAQLWALLAFSMHWGIYLIMGITFRYQLSGAIFAPFFPVEFLPRWLGRQLRRLGAPARTEAVATSTPAGNQPT